MISLWIFPGARLDEAEEKRNYNGNLEEHIEEKKNINFHLINNS